MRILECTQFGNPILRKRAKEIAIEHINSAIIQELITNMRHTLTKKKLGIGLAAPQVGQNVALAVICIRPMPHRPKVRSFDLVCINPKITDVKGNKKPMWEGCISSGAGKAGLFAKVMRYTAIELKYYDETGKLQHKDFKGLPAHVIQHEVDHLNGILFVDNVEDTTTYMTYAEYKKRIVKKRRSITKHNIDK